MSDERPKCSKCGHDIADMLGALACLSCERAEERVLLLAKFSDSPCDGDKVHVSKSIWKSGVVELEKSLPTGWTVSSSTGFGWFVRYAPERAAIIKKGIADGVCGVCGSTVPPTNANHFYCSDACSVKAWNFFNNGAPMVSPSVIGATQDDLGNWTL